MGLKKQQKNKDKHKTRFKCHTSRPTATVSKNSWLYLTNNYNVSVCSWEISCFVPMFWPNALCTEEAFYSYGTWNWYTNKKRHFEVVKVVNKWLLTNFLTFFLMNVFISLLTHAQALALVNIPYQNLTYLSVCFTRSDVAGKRVFRIVFLTTLVAPALMGRQKVCSESVSAGRNIRSESKGHVRVHRIALTGLI